MENNALQTSNDAIIAKDLQELDYNINGGVFKTSFKSRIIGKLKNATLIIATLATLWSTTNTSAISQIKDPKEKIVYAANITANNVADLYSGVKNDINKNDFLEARKKITAIRDIAKKSNDDVLLHQSNKLQIDIYAKIGLDAVSNNDSVRLRVAKNFLLNCVNEDRKSTRLNSSHVSESRMPSSA